MKGYSLQITRFVHFWPPRLFFQNGAAKLEILDMSSYI